MSEGDSSTPPEPAETLAAALDEYLARLEAGETPERESVLRAHPALGSRLVSCLDAIEFMHRAGRSLRDEGAPARLGDFEIIREVGRGGMGVVYEAEQVSLKRRVALKVLRFGPAEDEEALRRFQREAETVAQLHHTNIVPIFAVGHEGSIHYYAMQFIDGESLAQRIERASPAREVAQWGLQAAEALEHAHERGVIHRDVKPSNLMLGHDGRVWLTDFGLAKRLEDVALSASGILVGTPRYMSPEQASLQERPIDHRTDLYSLGATLYELVIARPVVAAETARDVLTSIQQDDPIAPRQIDPSIPRDLETVLLHCLAKDPGDRYEHASQLSADLRAVLEDRPIRARRPNLLERGRRWARREQRAIRVAVGAIVVTLLALLVTWNQVRGIERGRMGRLSLTRKALPLVADVWELDGAAVERDVAVPTLGHLSLPEGAYEVRVRGAGACFRRDYLVDVERSAAGTPVPPLYEVDVGDAINFPVSPEELATHAPPQPDLDGDGVTELVVIEADEATGSLGVRVADGATREPRWRRVLWPDPTGPVWNGRAVEAAMDGWLAIPDLDGDGHGELVVASHGALRAVPTIVSAERVVRRFCLFLDVLSGSDGTPIHRCRADRSAPFTVGELRRWNADAAGWPQLLVPLCPSGRSRDPTTLLFSLGHADPRGEVPGVDDPITHDVDGDGRLDLCIRDDRGSVHRIRADRPVRWRRLGIWKPVGDLDGDGWLDLVEDGGRGTIAISGRDGRRLPSDIAVPDQPASSGEGTVLGRDERGASVRLRFEEGRRGRGSTRAEPDPVGEPTTTRAGLAQLTLAARDPRGARPLPWTRAVDLGGLEFRMHHLWFFGALALLFAVLPWHLYRRSPRRGTRKLRNEVLGWALIPVFVGVVSGVNGALFGMNTFGPIEIIRTGYTAVAIGLPLAVWTAGFGVNLVRRRWTALTSIALTAALLSAVAGFLFMQADDPLPPGGFYLSEGWIGIVCAGASLTGMAMLLACLWRWRRANA